MTPAPMAPVVKPKSLHCTNCGGPVELRGFGHTMTVVCPQCLSLLDASTPLLQTLQRIQEKQRRQLHIPLGTRGKFNNIPWEVIGFQARQTSADGETFEWHEYLLFNPYVGFRYITQYNGHWNFVTPLEAMPIPSAGTRPLTMYEQRRYLRFSGAVATTVFVLGEFPWRVKAGETVRAEDFVSPPYILSLEASQNEVNWSQGVYISGAEVWKAFALPGSPPPARGTYLNQPSPYSGKPGHMWKMFFLFVLMLFGLMVFFEIFSKNDQVLAETHRFSTDDKGETSFVTKEFELKGRPANVELKLDTNLSNSWAYFNFALINEDTGEAYDFGQEVSYYSGSDSDGSWTEGDKNSSVLLPAIPPGKYFLRVEPEMDETGQYAAAGNSVSYELTLRHDVPSLLWFFLAAGLLLIPPIWYSIRATAFEAGRWRDSDYAPSTSSSSSSDSDDD